MYGIFFKPYFSNLNFFLDLQKIKNYKNNIIKKIRGNSIVAEKKRKKSSSRWSTDRIYGGVIGHLRARKVFWDFIVLIIALFVFTSSLSTKVTRVETAIRPLLEADIPAKLGNIESDIENISITQRTQIDLLSNIIIFQNLFNQLRENSKKILNPEIKDGLKAFLGKVQEKEFIEINNSSISDVQKVIEIIVKIGGIEKLMDLLGIKDKEIGYGVVILFVENYDF